MENNREGLLLWQPMTPEQNSCHGYIASASIPVSTNRSFISAAELNDELLGCSEIPMSAAATSGELGNSDLLINLTSSILSISHIV